MKIFYLHVCRKTFTFIFAHIEIQKIGNGKYQENWKCGKCGKYEKYVIGKYQENWKCGKCGKYEKFVIGKYQEKF